jgi:hypothetical protein
MIDETKILNSQSGSALYDLEEKIWFIQIAALSLRMGLQAKFGSKLPDQMFCEILVREVCTAGKISNEEFGQRTQLIVRALFRTKTVQENPDRMQQMADGIIEETAKQPKNERFVALATVVKAHMQSTVGSQTE